MSWPEWFKDHLNRPGPYMLGTLARRVESAAGLDSAWAVCAQNIYLSGYTPCLAPVEGSAQSVGVRSWESSAPGFSLTIAGQAAISAALSALSPGSIVEVCKGTLEEDPGTWPAVEVGQLTGSVQTPDGRLVLQFAPLLASLRQRWTLERANLLFANAGNTETLTANYTVGNANLNVGAGNTDTFELESGGTGVVLITPSSGADPFYLTYTGKNVGLGRLTGVSTTGRFGTTAVNAASTSTVTNVAYLNGHPLTLLLRILLAGTGHAFDTLPDTWGFQMPSRFVDVTGIVSVRDNVLQVATGTYRWEHLIHEPLDNGLTWLRELLARAGVWLCQRQGQITARAAQDPHAPGLALTDVQLSDRYVRQLRWHPHDPRVQGIYYQTAMETREEVSPGSFFAANGSRFMPAFPVRMRDLTATVWQNGEAIRTEANRRMGPWDTRIPGLLQGWWPGLGRAKLTIGDIVYFTSEELGLLLPAMGSGAVSVLESHPAMIVDIAPDWEGGGVSLSLAILPEDTT